MTRNITAKAEKAGEKTAECAHEKTQRVRRRLQVDDELRGRLLLGAAVAAGAALLGTGGWFLFKRRDDIKKGLKEARETIKEKIEHHTGHKGTTGTAKTGAAA